MLISEIISIYLKAVLDKIKDDADSKGQKLPSTQPRIEVQETSGQLYWAHYLKYLVHGRGPGKFPPPDAMRKFVLDNPHILADARTRFRNISVNSLAYLIGRKIAREGTDIYQGKKPGVDLDGSIAAPMEDFLKMLAFQEAVNVGSAIKQAA